MNQTQSQVGAEALEEIRRGVPVYDSEYIRLGTVSRIYWGSEFQHPDSDEFEVFILGVLTMPAEFMEHLRQVGGIRVDTGMLFGDYFVLPHQIGPFTEDGIILLVRGTELAMY